MNKTKTNPRRRRSVKRESSTITPSNESTQPSLLEGNGQETTVNQMDIAEVKKQRVSKRRRSARSVEQKTAGGQESAEETPSSTHQTTARPSRKKRKSTRRKRPVTSDEETAQPETKKSTVTSEPSKSRRSRGRSGAREMDGAPAARPAGEKRIPTARSRRAQSTEAKPDQPLQPLRDPDAREMLINVSAGDECRIAILAGGRLEELFLERTNTQSHVGNIYKGRVTNIEPSIQAAFVDFGLPQNGFLHISDVQPQYFPNHKGGGEEVGRKIPRHSRPPIQKCFRRGQEVIVQVIKESVGSKGPTLTTYLSIPGRFLVMMPGLSRHGVSRKIEDDGDRHTMRQLLKQLDLPKDMGFILRTAGLDQNKRELQRDLNYLTRLWSTVVDRIKTQSSPTELYQESDLVTRTIRDVYSSGFSRIVVDDANTSAKVMEFLSIAMPRTKVVVELYRENEPLFHRFGIEEEIDKIHMRHVPLASGGSLVIDSTEALVAIDVNSGKFRTQDDAEESAFQLNMEAAEEIARQLRLRDLGGLIVCDFIDMRQEKHRRAVERTLRDALKKHKERARILRMSAFGLIEMTRQRQGPALKRNVYNDCTHCQGSGLMKMPGSVVLDVMRMIHVATNHKEVHRIIVTVSQEVAHKLLNEKRATLNKLETETKRSIEIRSESSRAVDRVSYRCEDVRGRPVSAIPATSHLAS